MEVMIWYGLEENKVIHLNVSNKIVSVFMCNVYVSYTAMGYKLGLQAC